MSKTWEYIVDNYRVVDGDSVNCTLTRLHQIDVGFGMHQQILSSVPIKCRLKGIDAAEIYGRNADKDAGQAAKQRLEELMAMGEVRAVTHKPIPGDKYGRWLVDLYVTHEDEFGSDIEYFINQVLIDELFAEPYDGGKRS